MTRARIASYGLVPPPPLDRWIEAVLMLCVSLVQSVRATFGMRRCSGGRDWHTQSETSALPQTKRDIQLETTTPNHAVILGLVPRTPVGSTRGKADAPLETLNQDSRDKPENDTVDVATPTPVIPAEARQRVELETRGRAHKRLHMQPLDSGSRYRASGMTICVRLKTA